MSYLRQMQNSFAGELSLPQALRDLTNVVPGSLNLDGRPQLLFGYLLCEPSRRAWILSPLNVKRSGSNSSAGAVLAT